MPGVILENLGLWLLTPVVVTISAVFRSWSLVVNVVLWHRDRWLVALAVEVVTNFLVAAAGRRRGVAFRDGVAMRVVCALNGTSTAEIRNGLFEVRVSIRARR